MTDKNIDINLLIKNLGSPNDDTREEAAAALIGVTDKRIVPALLNSLETDDNPGVKHFVKKALLIIQKEHGDIKTIVAELAAEKSKAQEPAPPQSQGEIPQAKPEDMPDDTRQAVDTILRRLKEKDAALIEEAREQLPYEEDPYIRATYVSAIGRLGDESNMGDIISFLSDPDFRVLANAVEALERLGNPQCVEALVKLISHKDNRVRANVIKALWKFTDSNVSINRHVIDKLKQMLESDNADMCESALYVLSEIADEESIDILDKAAYSDNLELSAKASVMLDKAKLTYSERKAKTDDDVYINGVIEKLSRGSADSSKGIDEATRVRIDEIQSYIDTSDVSKLPQVLKALAAEQNTFIRATLISAVGKLGGRNNMDALLPFVKDADARVVANVVQALESIGNPKCVEHIVKLVAHADNRVRANTVKAIWKFAHTNVTANRIVFERLKEMMFSTKNQMRESAIYVLGEIGDDESIDLLSIAANDKSPDIKAKAEEALKNALKIKAERELETSTPPVSEEEISRIPSLDARPPRIEPKAEPKIEAPAQPKVTINLEKPSSKDVEPEPKRQQSEKVAPAAEPEKKQPAAQPALKEEARDTAPLGDPIETSAALEPAKVIDDATRKEIDKIQKLIDAGDSSSLEDLVKRLAAEKNTFIKATLVSAVGKLGGRDNMEAVIGFLNDEDTRVVANTAEALENLGNSKCVEELIKHINHNDNRVRANVVKAIWKYAQSNMSANRVILARLKTMMFSSKAQMRESALYVLGEIASDEALELITIAVSDKVESVQQKAKEALERAEARRKETPAPAAAKTQSFSEAKKKTPQSPGASKTQGRQKGVSAAPLPQASKTSGAPVRRMSFFKLLFILMFFFTLSLGGGFSVYWFVMEGKDYQQLETAVKALLEQFKNPEGGGDTASAPASSQQTPPAGQPGGENAPKPPEEIKKQAFTINDQVDMAKQYLNEGHFSEVITSLAKSAAKYPQNADLKKILLDAYYRRGQSLFNLEIYDAAKLDFTKITELDAGGGYSQKAQSYIDKISKFIKK
ncbi:MAG TPA: hypothetical protein DC017_11250 [Candidatus Wallbacteria bacterium]|nr:hypothetical protein [Candidatus Wallbacteria bacterium]